MADFPPVSRVGRAHPSLLDRYPEVRRAFLRVLARDGNLAAACAHCRVTRISAEKYIALHPEFAEQVQAAQDEHRAKIEQAIYQRGVEGVDVPVFGPGGQQTGTKKVYSDPLLLAYARRHIRDYREGDVNRTEVQVSGQVQHAVQVRALAPEQRQALRILLGDPAEATRALPPAGEGTAVPDAEAGAE